MSGNRLSMERILPQLVKDKLLKEFRENCPYLNRHIIHIEENNPEDELYDIRIHAKGYCKSGKVHAVVHISQNVIEEGAVVTLEEILNDLWDSFSGYAEDQIPPIKDEYKDLIRTEDTENGVEEEKLTKKELKIINKNLEQGKREIQHIIWEDNRNKPFALFNTAFCPKCKKDVKVTYGMNPPYYTDEKTGLKNLMGTFWVKCKKCREEFWFP